MSIKPIDLLSNMGQMHEVGRGEHARSGAVAEQQQLLDEEAAKQSRLINTKLDETKKSEKTEVRDALADDKEKEKQKKKQDEESREREKKKQQELSKDANLGRIIDILK